MAKATVHSLTDKEQALVAETRRDHLRSLDEDTLVELHARVRRARDKYVKLHRREVGQQVSAERARGTVSAAPRRSASKAEIFEDALARVSASLASAARHSAAALRADRLAAARGTSAGGDRPPKSGRAPDARRRASKTSTAPNAHRTPIKRKVAASTRAAGARTQAKRDAR